MMNPTLVAGRAGLLRRIQLDAPPDSRLARLMVRWA